ncbi:MAG: hypothetical protein A3D96_05025 [Chlamydiae bacterium RIFCSPHIGHO2_12_FULL_44_59]|nr:MAG: hypothetical protein A2796_03310 [Chlamydiae bacterium RIFCSPHIGHO2_01_FULL_44_39]OGN58814.1 MAG: hypothetical protein A3C42_01920 [Chlamydiae bacterium RIFCSPHIGHO2_02_FULL_45_9]OGN60183.1 MAG: hypothetical protein A3D96_05025 [Chlamydiae bacterium RIFCSPHIGHO2_12_FULL_44_59]OGN67164.1 MAG: hypothetical protein A2978_01015 [Chlamydiae bacterium RIFCSPLOWO2_01_FULL_44_52]OGN67754.1 MAG: hypothetical protein A3I67_04950 [Chlamydiae bacterium RIFCSPLOWO2_02_FULL_45_22]OGN71457.1 MAG: hyp
MSVSFRDFQPINTWKLDSDGSKWDDGEAEHLIDTTTGRRYWNESKGCVGFKCFLLTLGTPIFHSIASLVNVAYRIVKLVSFSHFWMDKEGEKSYSFKGRLKDAGQDLLGVLTTPIAFIGLELAAIYGIFTPYNGRKLYASIERAQDGNFILAPCFQPDPKYHALGGDPKKKNAF